MHSLHPNHRGLVSSGSPVVLRLQHSSTAGFLRFVEGGVLSNNGERKRVKRIFTIRCLDFEHDELIDRDKGSLCFVSRRKPRRIRQPFAVPMFSPRESSFLESLCSGQPRPWSMATNRASVEGSKTSKPLLTNSAKSPRFRCKRT